MQTSLVVAFHIFQLEKFYLSYNNGNTTVKPHENHPQPPTD